MGATKKRHIGKKTCRKKACGKLASRKIGVPYKKGSINNN